jgi:hypothetical protein
VSSNVSFGNSGMYFNSLQNLQSSIDKLPKLGSVSSLLQPTHFRTHRFVKDGNVLKSHILQSSLDNLGNDGNNFSRVHLLHSNITNWLNIGIDRSEIQLLHISVFNFGNGGKRVKLTHPVQSKVVSE